MGTRGPARPDTAQTAPPLPCWARDPATWCMGCRDLGMSPLGTLWHCWSLVSVGNVCTHQWGPRTIRVSSQAGPEMGAERGGGSGCGTPSRTIMRTPVLLIFRKLGLASTAHCESPGTGPAQTPERTMARGRGKSPGLGVGGLGATASPPLSGPSVKWE